MSQPETPAPAPETGPVRLPQDPKVRIAIQVFQFFLLIMLAMQVFVQKRKGDNAVRIEQQKAYQTESVLRREIYDLKKELENAQAKIKELEKASSR
ncbi:MAG: hypothetical protein K0Q55_630 [Verrucomicrobia bacterium]|jgi:uncharacterized protein YlxW (UPF0749 family)|nr:hypothetical protein [Verrucomicrobiota bacterium]